MASERANPTLIGAFVVGAAGLAALAVILFGSGQLFEERTRLVAYFGSSVTGLDIGAPVIFRGVNVGRVERIGAVVDRETFDVAVPVYFHLVSGRVDTIGSPAESRYEGLRDFIEYGLRAQLKSQSFITGKLYLDLDLHPESEAVYLGLDPTVLEMPTIPTTLEQFQRQFREVVERISKLPFEDLVKSVASAAEGLDELVNRPQLVEAIDELDATLKETKRLVANLGDKVDGLSDGVEQALASVSDAATQAQESLASLQSGIEAGSPLQYQVMQTLHELEVAARSFRQLADNLSRQPEQVIYGRSEKGSQP